MMRDRFYTTAELARICGVSISTIKRWTDSGQLRCVRTPGGHRKFRVVDVAEAARRLGTPASVPEAPAAARIDELALLLLQDDREALGARIAAQLERGDAAAFRRLLLDLHRHGMRPSVLADAVQAAIGTLRRASAADADDTDFVYRRGSMLAAEGVRHLRDQLPPPVPESPAALLAAAAGCVAEPWPALCAWLLSELGWNVTDLGPDVPEASIRHGMMRLRPALVVIVGAIPERDLRRLSVHAEALGATLAVLPADATAPLPRLAEQARAIERHVPASCA